MLAKGGLQLMARNQRGVITLVAAQLVKLAAGYFVKCPLGLLGRPAVLFW